jgi:hypothetical protein
MKQESLRADVLALAQYGWWRNRQTEKAGGGGVQEKRDTKDAGYLCTSDLKVCTANSNRDNTQLK